MTPEVDLSVLMGVAGWGLPIYSRVVIIGSSALALCNNACTSTSTAYDMKFIIILESVRTVLLFPWVLWKYFELRKQFPRHDFWLSVHISNIHICGCAISCLWSGNVILCQGA